MNTEDKRRRAIRRIGRWLAVVAVAVLALYLLRYPLLTVVGKALLVNDPLEPADLIYVMGGAPDVRPPAAAQLYHAGYARRIAVPLVESLSPELAGLRLNPALEAAHILQRKRVPRAAITILRVQGGSTSTREDARILASYVRREGFTTVIVVTSELHTRRARWALRKALKGQTVRVIMSPAINPNARPNNWWKTETGMLECATEYLKFVHNLTTSGEPRVASGVGQ